MGLDCNTPQGRKHIAEQNAIITKVCECWGCQSLITPDDKDSPVDVMFSRDGRIVAVAEIKSRPDLTLDTLKSFAPPTDGYLITLRKLQEGVAVGVNLRVPYYVFVGLAGGVVVYWRISDEQGTMTVRHTVARTKTKATCNGGVAYRENAYLKLDGMQFVTVKEAPAPDIIVPSNTGEMVTADEIRWW
jgi:hypothetical protein